MTTWRKHFTAGGLKRAGAGACLLVLACFVAAQEVPRRPRRQPAPAPPTRVERAANEPVGAAVPIFSPPGGVFTNGVSVTLKANPPAATVRYTVDGSEPTADSPAYAAALAFTNTTLLKARAFEAGQPAGATRSQTYTMLDPGVLDFSSNLPLILINTFNQYVSSDTKIPVSVRFIEPDGQRAWVNGSANFDGRGELRIRGYSSLRFPKHSFTLKTTDDAGRSLKAPLLGFPKDSDWVLYAPYSDKTLIRDALAYELSNKTGHYAPRTKFVEVYVSVGGRVTRNHYQGVYVFEEKIKRGKDRVDIESLGPDDNSEPKITGGYIFKRDHTEPPDGGSSRRFRSMGVASGDREYGFMTGRGVHLYYVEPKEKEITPAQRTWLNRHLNEFESALYGPRFASPTEGYAKYLDVDSFIDHHWIVEMSKNIDGLRYSCFMQKDRGGKIKMEPVWDWNLSFGNANYHEGWTPQGWYYPLLRETEISWFRRLVQDPDFEQKHIDRWAELRRNQFAPEKIVARVDEMAAQLDEAQARNFRRWPVLGRFVNPNWYVGRTYRDEIGWMKQWIQQRIDWIDSQFLAAPRLSLKAGAVAAGSPLTLRVPIGRVYYTTDGTDPRLPGGGVSPKARVFKSPMALNQNTRLFARARNADAWSAPVSANYTVAAAAN